MGIYLNPDNEGFREAIHSKIYVDKTGLIAHTNQCVNTEQKFLCVSRPRRFGKSVVEAMNCRSFSMHVPVNTRSFQNDMYHLYIKDDALDLAHTQAASALSYNDENSLSCAIGLAYYSARKDYKMIREFPTGHGFTDIVFLPLPHTTKPALVVELKYNKTARALSHNLPIQPLPPRQPYKKHHPAHAKLCAHRRPHPNQPKPRRKNQRCRYPNAPHARQVHNAGNQRISRAA